LPKADVWQTPGVRPLDLLGAPREPLAPGQVAASASAPPAKAPLPFGAVLLAGLLLLLVRTLAEARQPSAEDAADEKSLRLGILAAALFGLVFSLEASTGWNRYLPLVRVLQFSWRGLGLATVAASLGIGLALAGRDWRGAGRVLAVLVLAAVWGEGWLHAGAHRWLQPWDALGAIARVGRPDVFKATPLPRHHRRISGFAVPPSQPGMRLSSGLLEPFFEYTNRRASALGRTGKPKLAVTLLVLRDGTREKLPARPYAEWWLGARSRPLRARALGGRISVRARKPGNVLVREQCFPGWQVRTASGWQPAACSSEGFLQTTVSRAGVVEWRFFAWRWPRVLGMAISILALIVLVTVRRVGHNAA
jgi:hypothetical protein